jgi:hypothetical protein
MDYPEMAILLAILIQVSNFMMDKILQKCVMSIKTLLISSHICFIANEAVL